MNHIKLKQYFKKNLTINYIYNVTKGLLNKEYKKEVIYKDVEKDNIFTIERKGKKNKGKIVYLYDEIEGPLVGFFAIYRYMIESCFFAEMYGFVPVFHWSDLCCYGCNGELINGSTDAYGQYFLQPAVLNYEEAMNSFAVITSNWEKRDLTRKMMLGHKVESLGYEYDEQYLKKMGKYAGKYIHLNPEIEKSISDERESLLGTKKTLAVHVRIKGFQNVNRHPKTRTLAEYIEEIKDAISTGEYEQIFVATAETRTIDDLKEVFGDLIVSYNDVLRVEDGNSLMVSSERKHHKYLLGYEVLRDALTMVDCDGFIAGLSQISFGVLIMKYARGEEFGFKKIFNLGINHTDFTTAMQIKQRYSDKRYGH